jgi:hypothetical protein
MEAAKDALGKIDDVKDLVEEHGDKLPGGLGDKAKEALDKVEQIADKIPGQD